MPRIGDFVANVKTQGTSCQHFSLGRKQGSRLSKKGDWENERLMRKVAGVFRSNAKFA